MTLTLREKKAEPQSLILMKLNIQFGEKFNFNGDKLIEALFTVAFIHEFVAVIHAFYHIHVILCRNSELVLLCWGFCIILRCSTVISNANYLLSIIYYVHVIRCRVQYSLYIVIYEHKMTTIHNKRLLVSVKWQ